jgi:hypothetical protein
MARTELRASHQSRVNWWRTTLRRQREGNLSVAEFCRRLGVAVSTFYYWKNRVYKVPSDARGQVPDERHLRRMNPAAGSTSANFVPVSILDPTAGTQLEIELTNACVVRLRGSVDPSLLHAAITAAGQLDGCRQGAN